LPRHKQEELRFHFFLKIISAARTEMRLAGGTTGARFNNDTFRLALPAGLVV
jgi:hypothetical protein